MLQMLITLVGVSFLTFCLTYIAPGDPAMMVLEAGDTIVSEELIQKTRAEMGLDKPFLVQYANWVGGLLHGDILPGLYRWVFPGRSPSEIKTDNLNPEDAQLVLPGVDEFSAEIPTNDRADDNRKEYSGQFPAGISIRIGRNTKDSNNDKDTFNRIEKIITFP